MDVKLDEAAKEEYLQSICDEWLQVEANELVPSLHYSDQQVLSLAMMALLVKNHTQLNAPYKNALGKPDPLLAYPKLIRAAKNAIQATSYTNKVNAHVVLGILSRPTCHSESEYHFTKALEMQPRNWRLQSQLASTYMMTNKLKLCLHCLNTAIDLVPTDCYDRFDLRIRKSKVLYNLGLFQQAKASFEQLLQESIKYEKQMTPKEVGHLAVAQYMLCQLYTNEQDKENAIHHWNQAEAKRNKVPLNTSRKMDWSSRTVTKMCVDDLMENGQVVKVQLSWREVVFFVTFLLICLEFLLWVYAVVSQRGGTKDVHDAESKQQDEFAEF